MVSVGPRGAAETRLNNPDLRADVLIPFPAVDGRIPTYDMGYGTVGFTPFRKTDDEARIRELLSVVDYLSAPFGTTEYMQTNWGEEGKEYTVEDGNYVLTDEGSQNVPGLQSALQIMAAGEGVIYNPIPDDFATPRRVRAAARAEEPDQGSALAHELPPAPPGRGP